MSKEGQWWPHLQMGLDTELCNDGSTIRSKREASYFLTFVEIALIMFIAKNTENKGTFVFLDGSFSFLHASSDQ